MFRSSMRSSSGSSLFTSLSMFLMLKIIKIFKKYYHPSCLCGSICLVCLYCVLCGGVSLKNQPLHVSDIFVAHRQEVYFAIWVLFHEPSLTSCSIRQPFQVFSFHLCDCLSLLSQSLWTYTTAPSTASPSHFCMSCRHIEILQCLYLRFVPVVRLAVRLCVKSQTAQMFQSR